MTCEILWALKVLYDLGIKGITPVPMFCDNDSAIKLAMNPVFHEKTKHFEVDVHFVRNHISRGTVELCKIDSDSNPADVLTKSLCSGQHDIFCKEMMLSDPYSVSK